MNLAAGLPDILRLLVIPVFAWAAWRDLQTRRVPNRLWPPLYLIGGGLLLWETGVRWPLVGVADRAFLVRVGFSLLVVAPLAYVFWQLGGFGGADAKALIAVAVLFPIVPSYTIPLVGEIPTTDATIGVFSLTIFTNALLVAACYPAALTIYNGLNGDFVWAMFLARPVPTDSLRSRHGRLFESRDGVSRGGVDLDALRMYLRWRGLSLTELRSHPDRYRDADSVDETYSPTDGATHRENSITLDGALTTSDEGDTGPIDSPRDERQPGDGEARKDDRWAVDRFLIAVEGTAYGTSSEMLREGLDLIAERDRVWISPGIPFIIPIFFGLLISLSYGDILFGVLLIFEVV